MRKLASIELVTGVRPIEGADRVEVLQILGWEVVSKKGDFRVGDLCVYCQCDSIMPEKPEFEFLRERKFRIKIIRLKKQISQGIAFPLSILPSFIINKSCIEGTDVTDILGIVKHDPQLQEEKALAEQLKSKSKINKFFMNFAFYRYIYFKFNKKDKGWPSWIQHTDEERIQKCAGLVINRPNQEWYISEKVDGSSGTFFVEKTRKWGIPKLNFGVCSRNIRLSKPDESAYWKMAKKYALREKLLLLRKASIVVQGECTGGKLQGNKYKLPELDFFVFNVIDNGTRYSWDKMVTFCNHLGFKTVPLVQETWVSNIEGRHIQEIVKELVAMSIGKSALNKDIWREGIVVRLKSNPNISFKVVNPEFLLKYNE